MAKVNQKKKEITEMPKTKKFKKLLASCRKEYGKEKGTQVAYATAKKKGWRT
ncbi:MAG: hypothetical protein KKH98_12945 [Spirochaetes bacterium]|nr:hypothetical protein [Spirochaetota bacterium]